MTVNLSQLLFGLLLLWFPRQWMRFGVTVGPRRRRSPALRPQLEPWQQRESGDPRVGFREFAKGRNYFDLLRGVAGGLAVMGGAGVTASIAQAPGSSIPEWQLLALKLAVAGAGLLIQTVRYERRHLAFFAPIFFIAGLSVALCSPWSALFAFVLIWAVNPMLRDAQAFLTVYSVVVGGFGVLFHEVGRVLPIAAFLFCFTPVLLSLLARRPLVVFTRKPAQVASAGG